MEKRKSVRAHTFAWALIIVFLLSSLIGTIAAVKPARPGKPVETWDLTIRIGLKDENGNPKEDIVLMDPDSLLAEDVACSGGLWDTLVGKGIKGYVSAQVSLYRWYDGEEWFGHETCGTYYLANVEGKSSAGETTYLDQFHHDSSDYTIVGVSIGHNINRLGQNYWWFMLQWVEGPPFEETSKRYYLWAWTNKDSAPEGTLSDTTGWLVEFNNADAMIYSSWDDADGDGVPDTYDWKETVSFTVTITRSPHIA